MLEGEVFQHPLIPAVKETNMKKNPTMKRATMARLISETKDKVNFEQQKRTVFALVWLPITSLTYSCHFLLAKCLGDILLVRDVVLQVPAPGLHGGHVQLHPVPQGGLGLVAVFRLLPREALPEEPPGAGEVEGALVHVELHLTPRLL